MSLTLDTNLLVYAADVDAGERHHRADRLLERVLRGACIQPLQTFAEFVHVAIRKRGIPLPVARTIVEHWIPLVQVATVDADSLYDAIEGVDRHGLAFWDALIWATARRAGCRWLLSEDLQNGRRLGGVTFVNPFDPANDALIDAILPPVGA